MDGAGEVLIERDDGVLTLTFNRPAKKNALVLAHWTALEEVTREAFSDPRIRVLVLTGAGGNFSAGADLSGGMDAGGDRVPPPPPREVLPIVHEMRNTAELVSRLARLPKPTLAVVDGVCVGAALGLALACDLVLASDRARFGSVFVKRGLSLDCGTSWTLPKAVGLRRAKQMTFFGDMVDAPRALEWGLVNEVVPHADLAAEGQAWARRLAEAPTTAISLIKRQLDGSYANSIDQTLEEEGRAQHIAFTTSDMHEGIRSFKERRAPRFTGF